MKPNLTPNIKGEKIKQRIKCFVKKLDNFKNKPAGVLKTFMIRCRHYPPVTTLPDLTVFHILTMLGSRGRAFFSTILGNNKLSFLFILRFHNILWTRHKPISDLGRVSSETCFVSKEPKLEPKPVSALSETRCLFWLFCFNIETGSFGVSKQLKQTKDQPKQQKFVKISTFLIPHTISSVCFGCFNTGLKHRNKPKKIFCACQKTNQKTTETDWVSVCFSSNRGKKINCFDDPLIENVFWRFFLFCFRLFWQSSVWFGCFDTGPKHRINPRQTEKNVFWFCETNRKTTETDWVSVCFGFGNTLDPGVRTVGLAQRPCITRCWTQAVLCLDWLNKCWKPGGGGSCKGYAVTPAYTQSCPAVIRGVLQLWRRRITM